MVIRAKENLVGAWAFLIGIVLAIAAGILSAILGSLDEIVLGVLAILGLVVGFGFWNVSDNDVNRFLLASVALVIVSFAGIQSVNSLVNLSATDSIGEGLEFEDVSIIGIKVGQIISSILGALLMLLIPATIVVAIKSLFSVAPVTVK